MFSIVWRGVLLYFNIAEVLLDTFVVFVCLHCTCISKVSFRIATILLMNAKHNLTMAKVFVVMRVEFPNQNLIAMLSDESKDMQFYLMSYRIPDIFGRSIGKYFLLLFNIANALSIHDPLAAKAFVVIRVDHMLHNLRWHNTKKKLSCI